MGIKDTQFYKRLNGRDAQLVRILMKTQSTDEGRERFIREIDLLTEKYKNWYEEQEFQTNHEEWPEDLTREDVDTLIDLALQMNDREWFIDLAKTKFPTS